MQTAAASSTNATLEPQTPTDHIRVPQPRRSSLASSLPARRSSLAGSADRPRRRSSVTFSSSVETKEVPKHCPTQHNDLYYRAEDYHQFRKEHVREKRVEMRERAALMTRWKAFAKSQQSSSSSPPGSPVRSSKAQSAEQHRRGQAQQQAPAAEGGSSAGDHHPRITFGRMRTSITTKILRRSAGSPGVAQARPTDMTTQAAAASYRFTQSGGFAVPIDHVRDACASRPSIVGENLVNVSLPTPVKPAVRTARLA